MNNGRLLIGVHSIKPGGFVERWLNALRSRGIGVKTLDLLGDNPLSQVADCDGVMWHWAHYPHEMRMAALPILRVIEEQLHIPVFPDMATSWHYDDKIAQSYLLKALNIPHPRTWVFWRRSDAMAWCNKAVYPIVGKLSVGAGSQNVHLFKTPKEACKYVEQCFSGTGVLIHSEMNWGGRRVKKMLKNGLRSLPFVLFNKYPALPSQAFWMPQKNYALFQEFLPDNDFDTRVTVIGTRAFAFRRFNRPGDFRASGSGKIDYDPGSIDLRCVSGALEAARKLNSQSMAFDFMFRGKGREPVVGEISYCYADWAVECCPGHWDSGLEWHEGHLWPEEAHVEDFLVEVTARESERVNGSRTP